MTHCSIHKTGRIDWDKCIMERYDANNGIVLKHVINDWNHDVIFFIQGEDIGITKADSDETALTRARPLMQTLLKTFNRATAMAWEAGRKEAKAEIRKVLASD